MISEALADKLGFPHGRLHPLPTRAIGTAQRGSLLRILGEVPARLDLTFLDKPDAPVLPFKPAVVRGLAMECNISGPFLKGHGIDHLHTKDALSIRGTEIPLMATLQERRHAYAGESIVIPPMSIAAMTYRIGGRATGPLVGATLHTDSGQLAQWGVEAPCDPGDTLYLYNPTRNDQVVRRGSRIGSVEPPPSRPGGVGSKDLSKGKEPTSRPTEGPTLQEELQALINHPDSALTTPEERQQALDLLLDFADTFSQDGEFGQTDLVKHTIHTGPIAPVKCRNRPINPALVDDLRQQLDTWLRHGVIEPSQSPWSSALVAAKKKNGKTRWCVDYRALNEATTKDAYPMPLIEENLAQLAHSKVFSGVDGSGAFHVVALDEEAKPKTAFATPWGLFQFRCMPFGLCNAPATYSRLMHIVLQGIPASQALSYLDDTLVHSPNVDLHLRYLRTVLQAHRKAGLKLQPSKCQFFRREAEYLGHIVSEKGVKVMPAYTDVVRKWPLPTTLTEMKSFLGKVSYYRRFIKGYGAIAKPLMEATKEENLEKGKKIKMTAEIRKAHQHLRSALCQAPILAYPRFDGDPFIVDTDWSCSNRAIGAVLSQVQEGHERVICYGAKKLSASQANYSATKGELFAIIYFLRYWRYYLEYRKFILRTDHRALTWIRTMEAPSGMLGRWLDTLANFDFDVQYRKGTQHGNADGLSRAPHLEEINEEQGLDEAIVAVTTVDPGDTPENEEIGDNPDGDETEDGYDTYTLPRRPVEWAQEQRRDADLREVVGLLQRQQVPDEKGRRGLAPRVRHLLDLVPLVHFNTTDGTLRLQPKDKGNGVPVIPLHLEEPFARLAHELAGHRGVQASLHMLNLQAYSTSGAATVRRVIESCWPCQVKAGEQPPQRHTYRTVVSGFPFQRLSIDFVGPLRTTSRGNTCILTVKDTFSKWVEAFPLPAAKADAAAAALTGEVFARYGYPDEIHSDRGTVFTGNIMRQLSKLIGYHITWTPAYHPQSNPVERAHRDLKSGLRAALETVGGQEWDTCLPQILFAFRCSPARGTGHSPFELLFGRHPNIPIGALDPPPHSGKPLVRYVAELKERMERIHRWARENLSKEVARQQRAYSSPPMEFQEGDWVWYYNPVAPKGGKFARRWTGPWEVWQKLSPVLYILRDGGGRPQENAVPIDRLKPYMPSPHHQAYPPSRQGSHWTEHNLDLTLLPRPSYHQDTDTDSGSEDESEADAYNDPVPPAAPPQPLPPAEPQPSPVFGPIPPSPAPPVPCRQQRPGELPAPGAIPDRDPDEQRQHGTRGRDAGPMAYAYPERGDHHAATDAAWADPRWSAAAHPGYSTPWTRRGTRPTDGSSAGRTPYWQNKAYTPGNPDAGATSSARRDPSDHHWKHQPVDFYLDSPPDDDRDGSRVAGGSNGAARHPRAVLPPHLQQDESRDPRPRALAGPLPRAPQPAVDVPGKSHGSPPPLRVGTRTQRGPRKRGRPRMDDPSVYYPTGSRTRAGHVEKPYLRSDAARERQQARAWAAHHREEQQRQQRQSSGRAN